jgi:hypothetical protein
VPSQVPFAEPPRADRVRKDTPPVTFHSLQQRRSQERFRLGISLRVPPTESTAAVRRREAGQRAYSYVEALVRRQTDGARDGTLAGTASTKLD